MKRSRRSLGVLLAAMSLALVMVRATTLTARPVSLVEEHAVRLSPRPASKLTVRAVAPPVVRMVVPRRKSVSAIAVIVVLPRAEAPLFRMGWSGCTAFANGCDHQGRSLAAPIGRQPGVVDRWVIAGLGRLLAPLDRAGLESARLLLQIAHVAASLHPRETLAGDWPKPLPMP